MRDDLPEAAIRLSAVLPVRTHLAPEPVAKSTAAMRRLRDVGSGGHNKRGIKIEGREYVSVSAAKRALSVGHDTISKWLDSGTAEYV